MIPFISNSVWKKYFQVSNILNSEILKLTLTECEHGGFPLYKFWLQFKGFSWNIIHIFISKTSQEKEENNLNIVHLKGFICERNEFNTKRSILCNSHLKINSIEKFFHWFVHVFPINKICLKVNENGRLLFHFWLVFCVLIELRSNFGQVFWLGSGCWHFWSSRVWVRFRS